MKIIFLARLFYPHIGGVEKHAMEISKILLKKGSSVSVITEQLEGTKAKEEIDGITIYRVTAGGDDWFKKFRIWKGMWDLRDVIDEADIVHCHDIFFWYLPFRFLFPRKPVYTTFHGHEEYPISKKTIILRKLFEKLSRGTILVSDSLKKWYKANPTYVIYGAVYANKQKRIKEILVNKKLKIVLLGRLDADRGIETYIKVLNTLKINKILYEFSVLGDGPLRNRIEKYATRIGFVKNVDSYIQSADIIFSSSYLSILEALHLKKLVVAVYENPLKKDCLLETPFTKFIIASDNENIIYKKILYLMRHKQEKEKLLDSAYLWVSKQTWEKMSNAYLNLWNVRT